MSQMKSNYFSSKNYFSN